MTSKTGSNKRLHLFLIIILILLFIPSASSSKVSSETSDGRDDVPSAPPSSKVSSETSDGRDDVPSAPPSSEIPSKSSITRSSSGKKIHIGHLEVTLRVTPENVSRGDNVLFNYSVSVKDGSILGSNYRIVITKDFNAIEFLDRDWAAKELLDKNHIFTPISIPFKNEEIPEGSQIFIRFKANISLNASLGRCNLSSLLCGPHPINSSINYINITNSKPRLIEYGVNGNHSLMRSKNNYVYFNQTDLEIYYKAYDKENNSHLECSVAMDENLFLKNTP